MQLQLPVQLAQGSMSAATGDTEPSTPADGTDTAGSTEEDKCADVSSQQQQNAGSVTKDESTRRQIEIVKTGISYKGGAIFEWGLKEKTLKEMLDALNISQLFGGTLKLSTLKDRWRKAEKVAQDIIENEEKFVKLNQNGNSPMSELNQLYMDLAARISSHKKEKERKKVLEEEEARDAQMRFGTAMQTFARREGYDSAAAAHEALEAELEQEQPEERAQGGTPSPAPDAGVGDDLRGSAEKSEGGKRAASKPSHGRSTKRAATGDSKLTPDRSSTAALTRSRALLAARTACSTTWSVAGRMTR